MEQQIILWDGDEPELVEVARPLTPAALRREPGWDTAFTAGTWRRGEIVIEPGRPPLRGWLLDAAALPPGMSPVPCPVIVCGPCSSALDVTWRLRERHGLPPWSSVLAVSQWAGRGQLRRPWRSPAGNCYVTLRWPDPNAETRDLVPLLVGLALAEALDELAGVPLGAPPATRVKWPNDLLLGERKAGGILVEERAGAAVAGIGLNLVSPAETTAAMDRDASGEPPDIAGHRELPMGVLPPDLARRGPLGLWLALVGLMRRGTLSTAENMDSRPAWLPRLERRLAWFGREVTVLDASLAGDTRHFDKITGKIVGIHKDGSLRLSGLKGEYRLTSGTILPHERGG